MAEEERRRRVGESEIIRWFCYAGFAVCSVVLVVALTFNARWFPALVGCVVWGVPAVLMYRKEQDRREQLAVVAARQRKNAPAKGKPRFDFGEENGS
jgi:hypothetical protein